MAGEIVERGQRGATFGFDDGDRVVGAGKLADRLHAVPERDGEKFNLAVGGGHGLERRRTERIGAIGGAILGSILAGPRNADAGLLFGAATGAIVGSASDANAQAQARQAQAQINQETAQQIAAERGRADAYRRALSACLQGRGYTVN